MNISKTIQPHVKGNMKPPPLIGDTSVEYQGSSDRRNPMQLMSSHPSNKFLHNVGHKSSKHNYRDSQLDREPFHSNQEQSKNPALLYSDNEALKNQHAPLHDSVIKSNMWPYSAQRISRADTSSRKKGNDHFHFDQKSSQATFNYSEVPQHSPRNNRSSWSDRLTSYSGQQYESTHHDSSRDGSPLHDEKSTRNFRKYSRENSAHDLSEKMSDESQHLHIQPRSRENLSMNLSHGQRRSLQSVPRHASFSLSNSHVSNSNPMQHNSNAHSQDSNSKSNSFLHAHGAVQFAQNNNTSHNFRSPLPTSSHSSLMQHVSKRPNFPIPSEDRKNLVSETSHCRSSNENLDHFERTEKFYEHFPWKRDVDHRSSEKRPYTAGGHEHSNQRSILSPEAEENLYASDPSNHSSSSMIQNSSLNIGNSAAHDVDLREGKNTIFKFSFNEENCEGVYDEDLRVGQKSSSPSVIHCSNVTQEKGRSVDEHKIKNTFAHRDWNSRHSIREVYRDPPEVISRSGCEEIDFTCDYSDSEENDVPDDRSENQVNIRELPFSKKLSCSQEEESISFQENTDFMEDASRNIEDNLKEKHGQFFDDLECRENKTLLLTMASSAQDACGKLDEDSGHAVESSFNRLEFHSITPNRSLPMELTANSNEFPPPKNSQPVPPIPPPPAPPSFAVPPPSCFSPIPAFVGNIDFSKPPPNFNAFPPPVNFSNAPPPRLPPNFMCRPPPPIPNFQPYPPSFPCQPPADQTFSPHMFPPPPTVSATQKVPGVSPAQGQPEFFLSPSQASYPPPQPPLSMPDFYRPVQNISQTDNAVPSNSTNSHSGPAFANSLASPPNVQSAQESQLISPVTTDQVEGTCFGDQQPTVQDGAPETTADISIGSMNVEVQPGDVIHSKEDTNKNEEIEENTMLESTVELTPEPDTAVAQPKTTLLGKLQAKKRLLSFSMAKQGGPGKVSAKVNKIIPDAAPSKESEDDEKKEIKKRKKQERKILAIEEIMREEEKMKVAISVTKTPLPISVEFNLKLLEDINKVTSGNMEVKETDVSQVKNDEKAKKVIQGGETKLELNKKTDKRNKDHEKKTTDEKQNKHKIKEKYKEKDEREVERYRKDDKYRREYYTSRKYHEDFKTNLKETTKIDETKRISKDKSSTKKKSKQRRSHSRD